MAKKIVYEGDSELCITVPRLHLPAMQEAILRSHGVTDPEVMTQKSIEAMHRLFSTRVLPVRITVFDDGSVEYTFK